MAKDREQIMKELEELKDQVQNLQNTPAKEGVRTPDDISTLARYIMEMREEREKTNKRLEELNHKIASLRSAVESMYNAAEEPEQPYSKTIENREIPLSGLDSSVLEFVQKYEMVCADLLKESMHYKGRNAACTRLNRLYGMGLLDRFQLGHKVYYRYAGKATNTLIISPPQ